MGGEWGDGGIGVCLEGGGGAPQRHALQIHRGEIMRMGVDWGWEIGRGWKGEIQLLFLGGGGNVKVCVCAYLSGSG